MSDTSQPDVYLLLTALAFLQVQFAQQRRAPIADAIEDHLQRLEMLRAQLPPVLAHAIPRLRQQWQTFLANEHRVGATTSGEALRLPAVVIPFRKRQRQP